MSWPLGTEYFSLWSEFYTPEDIYHAFSTLSSLHFGLCTQTVHSFLADHLQNLLFSCLIVASHGELLWRYSKQNQAKASNVLHQSYKYFSGPCFPVLSMRMSCEMVLKAYLYLLLLTYASHLLTYASQAMKPVGLSGKEVKFVQHVCSLWAHVCPSVIFFQEFRSCLMIFSRIFLLIAHIWTFLWTTIQKRGIEHIFLPSLYLLLVNSLY